MEFSVVTARFNSDEFWRWSAPEPVRLLVCDHDRKFSRSFDDVFHGAGIRLVRTPIQAPPANGMRARFSRAVGSECSACSIVVTTRRLERFVSVFADHYNRHRGPRSLALMPPVGRSATSGGAESNEVIVIRRDRLGGLL